MIANSRHGEFTDDDTSDELKQLDQLAIKHGATQQSRRSISERPSTNLVPKASLKRLPRFMLVSYNEPPFADISSGVEIWVDRRNGSRYVIRMQLVRTAYVAAVRAGYDICEYYRIPEVSGDLIRFRFTRIAHPESGTSLDGEFTVTLSQSTGEVVRISR